MYSHNLEKDLFENCSNYVISKDKIKAKIEEYNKRKREKQGNYCTLDELIIDKKIQVLQELLEE